VKLIKDYDYVIEYLLGKVNVIVDALSCKNRSVEAQWEDSDGRELLELRKIGAQVETGLREFLITQLKIRSTLWNRVLGAQWNDVEVNKIRDKVKSGDTILDFGWWNNSYMKTNVLAKWWNNEKGNYTRGLRVEACNAP
jgi:6-phosphogluconate dehydrogenase (decarboxylating)